MSFIQGQRWGWSSVRARGRGSIVKYGRPEGSEVRAGTNRQEKDLFGVDLFIFGSIVRKKNNYIVC